MTREVEVGDEFAAWYIELLQHERASIAAAVEMLEIKGPELGAAIRGYASRIEDSKLDGAASPTARKTIPNPLCI